VRIGIDLGGTKIEGIVLDAAGDPLERQRRPTPAREGYQAILEAVRELVRALESRTETALPVGVGTPGAISATSGLLKNSNTVCLNGRPLQADLERALERPVRVANDANCFALSEAVDGAGRGAESVFGVILGTGVGGGLVLRGRLHQGLQRIAGEWGHNPLEAGGPACYCGRRGCVETFLSGPGLERDYRERGGEAGLDARAIAARAEAGDGPAAAALERYLDRFGRALAPVINILDPSVVVLGGGLSNLGLLYTAGRESLSRWVFNEELLTPLQPNRHGDSSGVRGAAWLWERGDAAWEGSEGG
jgi:fructokinase